MGMLMAEKYLDQLEDGIPVELSEKDLLALLQSALTYPDRDWIRKALATLVCGTLPRKALEMILDWSDTDWNILRNILRHQDLTPSQRTEVLTLSAHQGPLALRSLQEESLISEHARVRYARLSVHAEKYPREYETFSTQADALDPAQQEVLHMLLTTTYLYLEPGGLHTLLHAATHL